MSSLALPVAARGLDACGFVRRSLIIWDKGHIVIGRGHYHWRHETCWYAVKKGAQAHWTGDRKASALWEIDNPRKSETGHSGPEARRVYAAGHPQPQGRRLRSVRRVGHHGHCWRAGGAKRLRHRDRACLRRRERSSGGRRSPDARRRDADDVLREVSRTREAYLRWLDARWPVRVCQVRLQVDREGRSANSRTEQDPPGSATTRRARR